MICLTHMVPLKSARNLLKQLAGNNDLPKSCHMFFILKILHALTIKYILDGMSLIYIHIYKKKEIKIFPVSLS